MTTTPASGAVDASKDASHATLSAREETRDWILERLREVMEIAMQRVTSSKTPASDRIKWSRIAIGAGHACNAVLRDVEIDALKKEINDLKQLIPAKVGEDKDSDANED